MQEELSYLLFKKRRKNISLTVNKLGQVEVCAPLFVTKKEVDAFVLLKKDWIVHVKRKISALNKTPKAETTIELKRQKIVAKQLISERIKEYNGNGRFSVNRVAIKNMKSRWGSCSNKGNLNFNYRLIHLPPELLDYVVVHELCHLIEHNHGKNFWKEVGNMMPDYKNREKKIKQYLLC